MNRLEILKEIDNLNDNYENLSKAEQKKADKRLVELGIKLNFQKRKTKINQTLSKGEKMTTLDIIYLMEQEINHETISKSAGVSKHVLTGISLSRKI